MGSTSNNGSEHRDYTIEQDRTVQGKKRMLDALKSTIGVVTPALDIAGVSRNTFYSWKRNDPAFAKAVADLADVALDFAEHALHKQIQAGNATSTIFYLKTKGRHRGYVERVNLVDESKFDEQMAGLTPEEIKQRIAAFAKKLSA